MSTDQSTATSAENSMAMHNDWWPSGWTHVLPQHQGMMLCMIFGTATTRGLTGDLDDITRQIFGDELRGVFNSLGDNLDSPILWLDQDEVDDAESDEEREEIRAAAKRRETTLTGALHAIGMTPPATIRDLGQLMVHFGIATTEDGAWAMPEVLPRPDDVLTLPEDVRERLATMRRFEETQVADQAIIRHLVDDLGHPEELFTSLDRLKDITGEDIDTLRAALDHLVELGDAQLYRGSPRVIVAAKDLPSHARFHLVPDWDRFHEHRMYIRREN
jgi:hypothetical protein